MIATLFSATIIDRFWLVTSKKCCLNSDSFKVIFDDGNKSQWLFWGKRRQRKCVRKKFCPKMHPRNDQEFRDLMSWLFPILRQFFSFRLFFVLKVFHSRMKPFVIYYSPRCPFTAIRTTSGVLWLNFQPWGDLCGWFSNNH